MSCQPLLPCVPLSLQQCEQLRLINLVLLCETDDICNVKFPPSTFTPICKSLGSLIYTTEQNRFVSSILGHQLAINVSHVADNATELCHRLSCWLPFLCNRELMELMPAPSLFVVTLITAGHDDNEGAKHGDAQATVQRGGADQQKKARNNKKNV